MTRMKCPLCNQEIDTWSHENMTYRSYDCPCCGWFILRDFPHTDIALIRDETAAYFYYTGNRLFLKQNTNRINYVGGKDYFESKDFLTKYAKARFITKEDILAFYPKSFNERISQILLGFAKQSKFLGNIITLSRDELISALFVKRHTEDAELLDENTIDSQLWQVLHYLEDNKMIDTGNGVSNKTNIKILPDGWKRIDELQKNNPNNRDVFIAMSFDPKNDGTKDAIKTGIIDAGYTPVIMSEIIHNKQIVPMMFRLIRESKLLVMDVTDPNYGAYHEAGYALGLGKEIIITCREEEFNNPDNKPHFDIAQKQILVWKDYEDLTVRLSEWIKAIAG